MSPVTRGAIWRFLELLAGPAPRIVVDLAIIAGVLVAFRIIHLSIQLLGALFG